MLARQKVMSGRYLLRLPLGGFSVDVHVACDGRISLYPAAPFRLATLLHAWTIAQVGRGSSLKRQTGWVKSANPHNSHTSDPPNAPKERRNYRWLTPHQLSTGHELSVRMGFQISLGDGDYGSGISRYWDRHWSFHAGGRGAWAAAGL